MKPLQDDLDRYIESRIARDQEFAILWEESSLSAELQRRRTEMGLTQMEVAQKMGVSQPRVAEIEKRPLHVRTQRLMAYLDALQARLQIVPSNAKNPDQLNARS